MGTKGRLLCMINSLNVCTGNVSFIIYEIIVDYIICDESNWLKVFVAHLYNNIKLRDVVSTLVLRRIY